MEGRKPDEPGGTCFFNLRIACSVISTGPESPAIETSAPTIFGAG